MTTQGSVGPALLSGGHPWWTWTKMGWLGTTRLGRSHANWECIAYSEMGDPTASGFSCPEVHILFLFARTCWRPLGTCCMVLGHRRKSVKQIRTSCPMSCTQQSVQRVCCHWTWESESISRPNASGLAGTKHTFHQDNAAVEVVDGWARQPSEHCMICMVKETKGMGMVRPDFRQFTKAGRCFSPTVKLCYV